MGRGILVSVVPMQQQYLRNTCGIFSIAAAYHAAVKKDISRITLNESRLRVHLARCFQQEKLSNFHTLRKVTIDRPTQHNLSVVIHCNCSRPDSFYDMIMCNKCEEWLHFKCANISVSPDSDWFCPDCLKN